MEPKDCGNHRHRQRTTFRRGRIGGLLSFRLCLLIFCQALVWRGQLVMAAESPVSAGEPQHWAFLPVRRPVVPKPSHVAEIANPIDAFLLAELESRGLTPNPAAGRREQIRRLHHGITGLPPSPDTVKAFETDVRPDAWSRWVDELLQRPEYGEKWARHWLDVVRYAQSNGYERDGEKPLAWRYRDYVVRALNQDKPFDRFILENLAGDEIPNADDDSIIATGFQRLGVWDDEPDDKRMAALDELDDILSTTGAAFLGMTVGCARCHDHKFDPFPQRDYYQLLAFFNNLHPYENAKYQLDSANYLPLGPRSKIEAWQQEQLKRISTTEQELKNSVQPEKKRSLEAKLKQLKESSPPVEWALAARDRATAPEPAHILIRGKASSLGAQVEPGFPSALGGGAPPGLDPAAKSSAGRRTSLAGWIANRQNPLTARVLVNRIWRHHFGQGIVRSTTDFGRAGIPPTHPLLLDWLASEFMDSGWSIKAVQRLILNSNAYRRSSLAVNPHNREIDPDNHYLWRQALRRMDAEGIRDSILEVSGGLNQSLGGRGFFPHLAGEVLAGSSRPGQDWERSTVSQESRRSIYAYVRRTTAVPALESFDYNNTTSPLSERPVTTVAPQALLLLNDDFVHAQAARLATRIESEVGTNSTELVRRGFELVLQRTPTKAELEVSRRFLERQRLSASGESSKLGFRPDVPAALLSAYGDQLIPEDYLVGPGVGWTYHRGFWAPPYEGIRAVDRARGPFALWAGAEFVDGSVEGTLKLDRSSEFASILMRSGAQGDLQHGYEVVFDPRGGRVVLHRHQTNLTVLGQRSVAIPVAEPFRFRVELSGSRLRVWAFGAAEPLLEVRDSQPIPNPGRMGVRAWGAPISLDHVVVNWGDRHSGVEVPGGARLSGPWMTGLQNLHFEKALQSFCLMLLNLNEFVYLD